MFSRSVSSCVSPAIGLTTIVRSFSPQFGLPTQICESGIDKAKGRVSFERSPLLSDLSKIWFGFQITTHCHFRIVRSLEQSPHFPYASVITFAVRAFSCHPSAASFLIAS